MIDKLLKYAGIGPRQTPIPVCEEMFNVARQLDGQGWIVRSGHAEGADQAWALGHPVNREIYLPWRKFNLDGPHLPHGFYVPHFSLEIQDVARAAHPAFDDLSQGAQKLMMRNVCIILGPQLNDPVQFVAYWSPNRKPQGGTGNAVRLAMEYGIPCFNIQFEDEQERMSNLVSA